MLRGQAVESGGRAGVPVSRELRSLMARCRSACGPQSLPLDPRGRSLERQGRDIMPTTAGLAVGTPSPATTNKATGDRDEKVVAR
ncbi:hypothetical protein GCM10011612_03050 [Actinomyces gaoshouyii]|uniref:Uncharacterized protein n=1 Tax=Actinomyces gaoshouyii TaxID=1960083 RepID=A0A8H9H6V8_9ACTO|nr:hypothetical protein GCM10011612_03050 [Actinomyces gaoshouyii]